MNEPDSCPITGMYAIRSGLPVIGLGILILLSGLIGLFIPGIPVPPFPAMVIFTVFGFFLIWAGLTK